MLANLLTYFSDPVLRGPTIGSMLMGLSSSLVGVLVFFQRRSLIGEVLSHASYPGVILGIVLSMVLFPDAEAISSVSAICFAFIASLLGTSAIEIVTKKGKVHEDTALCFVLSTFFGVGVLGSSIIQQNHPLWFRAAQSYLFGQAATMTDRHILIYGFFALFIVLCCYFAFRYFQVHLFDSFYSKSIGMSTKSFAVFYNSIVALSVVIGIRSVGVVLMSSMLIAPAVFASSVCKKFSSCFVIAATFGVCCSFLGVVSSLEIPYAIGFNAMPTGPFIVVISALICISALFIKVIRGHKVQKLKRTS